MTFYSRNESIKGTMTKNTAIEELQQIIKDLAITMQEVIQEQKKTEKAQQKTEEAQQKTEEGLKRLEASIEKQSKNLDKASGDFTRKWGAFMEKLVKGQLVEMLQKRDIPVNSVMKSLEIMDKKSKDTLAEFDLLAINGDEMVVVEVKTTLSHEKLDKFLRKLTKYKHRIPVEKRTKIYGAVAYLDHDEESKQEAIEAGLFVIEAPRTDGDFAKIVNEEGFEPKAF